MLSLLVSEFPTSELVTAQLSRLLRAGESVRCSNWEGSVFLKRVWA